MMRVALSLDDEPLARRLASGVQPATPQAVHAVVTAEAQLAEAAGLQADAAQRYHEAAERWREFGNVPEHAYALLGQGRCLAALSKPGRGGAAARGARALRVDGLQAGARGDGRAAGEERGRRGIGTVNWTPRVTVRTKRCFTSSERMWSMQGRASAAVGAILGAPYFRTTGALVSALCAPVTSPWPVVRLGSLRVTDPLAQIDLDAPLSASRPLRHDDAP